MFSAPLSKRKSCFAYILAVTSFFWSVNRLAFAQDNPTMDLVTTNTVDVADANICGDINVIRTFTMQLDAGDVDADGTFILHTANLQRLQQEGRALIAFQDGLYVAARGSEARNALIASLGLTRSARTGALKFSSCHELGVADAFHFTIANDQLVPTAASQLSNYAVLRVRDASTPDADALVFYMYADVTGGKLLLFTVL